MKVDPSLVKLAVLVAALMPSFGAAQSGAFARYAVQPKTVADRAPVQLRTARSRRYRGALLAAALQPVNFAGRYVLTSIGCGAGCVEVAAIDTGAGTVAWLPVTVCCWPLAMAEPLEYRRDSRLLIVHGALNEKGSGVHAFVFDGRRFVALADHTAGSR